MGEGAFESYVFLLIEVLGLIYPPSLVSGRRGQRMRAKGAKVQNSYLKIRINHHIRRV
jgi:hypothetical protein